MQSHQPGNCIPRHQQKWSQLVVFTYICADTVIHTYISLYVTTIKKKINLRRGMEGVQGRMPGRGWTKKSRESDVILFELKAHLKSKSLKRRQLVNQPCPSLRPTQKDRQHRRQVIPTSPVGSPFPLWNWGGGQTLNQLEATDLTLNHCAQNKEQVVGWLCPPKSPICTRSPAGRHPESSLSTA